MDSVRERALRSLAQSLDLPAEVLFDIGSSTGHWGVLAEDVGRDTYRVYMSCIAGATGCDRG
jgi:hypothetical protein